MRGRDFRRDPRIIDMLTVSRKCTPHGVNARPTTLADITRCLLGSGYLLFLIVERVYAASEWEIVLDDSFPPRWPTLKGDRH